MAAMSGKDGKVTFSAVVIVDTLSWTLTKTTNAKSYGSNATSGGTRRVAGRTDWTGSFTFAMQSGVEEITEGSSAAIILNINATKTFTGTAMIETVAYNVDVNTGDIITGTATFGSNGAITGPIA